MTKNIHIEDRRNRRIAFALAMGVHVVAAIVALVIYLDEPEKNNRNRPVFIGIEVPSSYEAAPSQPRRERGTPTRQTSRPPVPNPNQHIVSPEPTELLDDLPLSPDPVPSIRERFSTELLQSMTQEEAFDSLMVLLDEYPEYKETILRKMIAGKGIDRIPDLYVSTGIRDIQMKMKFKTKYEYEAMRQQFLYGPFHDPVSGPWGYKKTGPMVNVIELVSWLVDLIEGK